MKNKTPIIITVAVVVVVAVIAAIVVIINNNGNNGNNEGQSPENNSSQIETNGDNNQNNTNANSQTGSIVGKWKYDDPDLGDSFVYTFNADGTGNYTAAGNFTYIIDGKNISITYNTSGATFDTVFEIDGDRLNMIDSVGNDTFYKRAK